MDWQPIETAPPGYNKATGHFLNVLFKGYSKGRSFAGFAYVSGWMDRDRRPVHNYSYKLVITHWMTIPGDAAVRVPQDDPAERGGPGSNPGV